MNKINYKELEENSFCVVKNVLNADILSLLSTDFNLIKDIEDKKFANSINNSIFKSFPAGKQIDIASAILLIKSLAEDIAQNTFVITNGILTPIYFSIKHGVKFGYHQDHESWFMHGNHKEYLNIWIPIIKSDTTLTNITVINFNKLFQDHPKLKFLENYGATRGFSGMDSKVIDDNLDKTYLLDFDLDMYSETPFLDAGDALIMRGDAMHKTQDTLTERVAISIRCLNIDAVLHKDHFNSTSNVKSQAIKNNFDIYQNILSKFETVDHCKVGDLVGDLLWKY